jgi:RNA polymerase sigma-70 factor (ECF subfamily)
MGREKISDRELLSRLVAGESEAFRLLIEMEKKKVLNICFRFVNDKEDAEELAQDTFIEVYRSISTFRGVSSLSTWIYRIAVSKSLNFIRNKKRRKRRGTITRLSYSDREEIQLAGSVSNSPDEILAQKNRALILQNALDSLPANQHAAFILSKYDEMSYEEIAAVMNISISAVESLIFRAKSNLQKKLYSYFKDYFRKL